VPQADTNARENDKVTLHSSTYLSRIDLMVKAKKG